MAENDLMSMGQCKKDVTPVRYQWSYVFLALTHRYVSKDHIDANKIITTDNDFVPSGYKLFPGPRLTQIYNTIWGP